MNHGKQGHKDGEFTFPGVKLDQRKPSIARPIKAVVSLVIAVIAACAMAHFWSGS